MVVSLKPNLVRLKAVLRSVKQRKPKLFNMAFWYRNDPCGTIACAFGSYVLDNSDCGVHIDASGVWLVEGVMCHYGFNVIAAHFGISIQDAYHLFAGSSYSRPTKSQVVHRLNAFIKLYSRRTR